MKSIKKLTNQHYTTTIDLEDECDVEVIITYNWTAGYAAQLYGDYPEPGADDEFEITEISRVDNGDVLVLLDGTENERLLEELMENESPAAEYEAEYADYLYDQMKDDQAERHFYPDE